MFLNLPFVHNSPTFEEHGYYYPDFDVDKGAEALKEAINEHPKRYLEERPKNEEMMWRYNPNNKKNVDGYIELLEEVIQTDYSQDLGRVLKNWKVLKLDSSYRPIQVICWTEAITMVMNGRASVVEYKEGVYAHSATDKFQVPSVIVISRYVKKARVSLKVTRKNLFIRDNYNCQ